MSLDPATEGAMTEFISTLSICAFAVPRSGPR